MRPHFLFVLAEKKTAAPGQKKRRFLFLCAPVRLYQMTFAAVPLIKSRFCVFLFVPRGANSPLSAPLGAAAQLGALPIFTQNYPIMRLQKWRVDDLYCHDHRPSRRERSEAFGDQSPHRTTFSFKIFFWTVNGPFSFKKKMGG